MVDQRWLDSAAPTAPLVRFQYGYDRNSNRMYRENLSGTSPDHSFDELYHRNGEGYDNFNQVLAFARGTLNGNKDSIATPTYYQKWTNDPNWTTNTGASTLDVQGNWTSVNTNGVPQTRTHNLQNQATVVGGANLTYSNNGEMKVDETGKALTYDAWGRLVQVVNGTTVTYAYDALGRRVKETNGTTKDFYYSAQWQLLEERHGGTVKLQYLWSPVYVDALILRDRDTGGGADLDERRYVLQDANWNVVAVTDPSGTVLERYVYEPYGKHTRLSASWGTPGADTLNWVYLHQGGRYEAATGLYHFRNRELSPALGRWEKPDPSGFGAGDTNLYRYLGGAPGTRLDPFGLEWAITRDPEEDRAHAESRKREDTIAGLAKQIHLEAKEYKKWASGDADGGDKYNRLGRLPETEHTPVGGRHCELYVPNKVLAYWGGEGGLAGRRWVAWGYNVKWLGINGYKVEEDTSSGTPGTLGGWTGNVFGNYIKTNTGNKSLHGVYFWGHATQSSIILDASALNTPSQLLYSYQYRRWSIDQKYKLGLGLLFGCDTNSGRSVFSTNAQFHGYTGTVWPVTFLSIISPPIALIYGTGFGGPHVNELLK